METVPAHAEYVELRVTKRALFLLFFSFVFSFQDFLDIFLEVPVRLYLLYQRYQQHLIKTSLFKERAKVIKKPQKQQKPKPAHLPLQG